MMNPFGHIGSLAASGSQFLGGPIPLVRARTVSITVRETCGGAINANTAINVYYSPDGNNWDTQVYTTAAITFSAGNTIQRTVIIDPPEHGYFAVQITNGSAADVLTNIRGWYSIQAWPPEPAQAKGDITSKKADA